MRMWTHQIPLDGLEEGMRHDLHEARLPVAAQALDGVLVEEALQDGGRTTRQRTRNADSLLENN